MKTRYCRYCKRSIEHNKPLITLCYKCANKKYRINPISKTNKNTRAYFDVKTRQLIKKRDKVCILCDKEGKKEKITDYHHVYYGHQAGYGRNRNNVDQGVGLCEHHHYNIHHGRGKVKEYRQFCIDYINKIYKK